MSHVVDLTASVSVRLYIPKTVLGQVNRKVAEIIRSNHLIFDSLVDIEVVLLPDTQVFYSLEYLSQAIYVVSSKFIEEYIPHSLYITVNGRKYDHYLYWFTKDLEEIGRACDVPRDKVTDTVNSIYPQSVPASIASPKIAMTYEDALMDFSANAWESEQQRALEERDEDSFPKLSQGELREAFLAKKLLEN